MVVKADILRRTNHSSIEEPRGEDGRIAEIIATIFGLRARVTSVSVSSPSASATIST